jgi:hypothetical protein
MVRLRGSPPTGTLCPYPRAAMAASNQVDCRVKVVELIHTGHGIPPQGHDVLSQEQQLDLLCSSASSSGSPSH